jgi:hypothetical protein
MSSAKDWAACREDSTNGKNIIVTDGFRGMPFAALARAGAYLADGATLSTAGTEMR